MLRVIVRDLLSAEPDFLVVGTSAGDEDPLARAHEDGADMLIVQDCSDSRAGGLGAIIAGPPTCIFAIAADGRRAAAVDLTRRRLDLETETATATATRFCDAIRSMAAGLS